MCAYWFYNPYGVERIGFCLRMINVQKISLMRFYYQAIATLTTEDSGQWSYIILHLGCYTNLRIYASAKNIFASKISFHHILYFLAIVLNISYKNRKFCWFCLLCPLAQLYLKILRLSLQQAFFFKYF